MHKMARAFLMESTRYPPHASRIEEKESIRLLENVRQSAENVGDSNCCVHIGDRESDIYELFSECESLE